MMRASIVILLFMSLNVNGQVTESVDVFEPVEWVYPQLDAANSRWFFFSSACRPFGMVNLSPDTEIGGAWGSGYRYDTDTIKGFSHIHGWQIAGVSLMPVSFKREPEALLTDFYSSFNHKDEIIEVGYHKTKLERYRITSEITSTKRVGFHRLSFEKAEQAGIIFQMKGKLGPSTMKDGRLEIIDEHTLYGEITNGPNRRRPKDFKVYYVVKLDQPIETLIDRDSSHAIVTLKDQPKRVHMKVAISYTSHENALLNLETELAGWAFDDVVKSSKREWNDLLSRIQISIDDSIATRRFYTDLWHGLQGRRTISDVNGAYPDNTASQFRIGQIPTDSKGSPLFNHYNSDSFWGAQWTINTLWGLVYPEIYSEFVKSLMLYAEDGGLLPRGPSGGNYTYVMTGASSTPFVVSAFQKNIDIGNPNKVYDILRKNHLAGGIMSKAGYEHETNLGGGLAYYIEKGYVPYPIPEGSFGYHQDGASLTVEYSFQDFALAQMANALGRIDDYHHFMNRSKNYVNVFDSETNWMRPKDIEGNWKSDFDPYQYENGFNEANGAQSTWMASHDVKGLASLMGGEEVAIAQLEKQFKEARPRGFTSGSSHERGEDPTRARVPINYGNQPSIPTAWVFSELERPDLTQKWVNEVIDSVFSGLSPYVGYKGDEDQGLMGSLAVLLKLGMFQLTGGTEADPFYHLIPPRFKEITIELAPGKRLKIVKGSGEGVIKEIRFNGQAVVKQRIRHSEVMSGGVLEFTFD